MSALLLALALSGCSSGCDRAESAPLPVGESVRLRVMVDSGFVMSSIDVNGQFYKQPTTDQPLAEGGVTTVPSPAIVGRPGERTAVVTRDATGFVMSVGEQSFRLAGPIRCE